LDVTNWAEVVSTGTGIASAAQVAAARVRPTPDVTFVLIRNPDCQPIKFNVARLREMKTFQ